jgi:Ser/Thr protein kinase RdoA (MazF antagonist)
MLVRLRRGTLASAVAWVEGAPLGEDRVPLSGSVAEQAATHRALGRLIAQVHATTDSLTLPEGFVRPRWDIDGLLGEAPLWGRFWDHPALTPDEAALARSTRDYLRERLTDHARAADQGLIHADILRENVFVSDGSPSLIDFDDAGFGFRLYDLGTAMIQNLDEPGLAAIAEALVEGYAETRVVDPAMVQVFTLMRRWASVGWTMPRLAAGSPVHRSHITRALRLTEVLLSGRSAW